MKFRNIFLLMLLLFASLSYSFKSENKSFETSSEIEFNSDNAILILDGAVIIENPEIASFDKVFIQETELNFPCEVFVVLKHPNLEVTFSHGYVKPLLGDYATLKELSVYSQIDRYLTIS